MGWDGTGAARAAIGLRSGAGVARLPHPPTPPTLPTTAEDGGQSWKREKAADSLAANLYEVVLTPGGLGFVLGNDGVLLRRVVSV